MGFNQSVCNAVQDCILIIGCREYNSLLRMYLLDKPKNKDHVTCFLSLASTLLLEFFLVLELITGEKLGIFTSPRGRSQNFYKSQTLYSTAGGGILHVFHIFFHIFDVFPQILSSSMGREGVRRFQIHTPPPAEIFSEIPFFTPTRVFLKIS